MRSLSVLPNVTQLLRQWVNRRSGCWWRSAVLPHDFLLSTSGSAAMQRRLQEFYAALRDARGADGLGRKRLRPSEPTKLTERKPTRSRRVWLATVLLLARIAVATAQRARYAWWATMPQNALLAQYKAEGAAGSYVRVNDKANVAGLMRESGSHVSRFFPEFVQYCSSSSCMHAHRLHIAFSLRRRTFPRRLQPVETHRHPHERGHAIDNIWTRGRAGREIPRGCSELAAIHAGAATTQAVSGCRGQSAQSDHVGWRAARGSTGALSARERCDRRCTARGVRIDAAALGTRRRRRWWPWSHMPPPQLQASQQWQQHQQQHQQPSQPPTPAQLSPNEMQETWGQLMRSGKMRPSAAQCMVEMPPDYSYEAPNKPPAISSQSLLTIGLHGHEGPVKRSSAFTSDFRDPFM